MRSLLVLSFIAVASSSSDFHVDVSGILPSKDHKQTTFVCKTNKAFDRCLFQGPRRQQQRCVLEIHEDGVERTTCSRGLEFVHNDAGFEGELICAVKVKKVVNGDFGLWECRLE